MRLRPYRDADADAVAAVHAAAHGACSTFPVMTADSWRRFTAASFNREARDFWVAEGRDEIAGVLTSTSWSEGASLIRHFRVVVRPETRRRGTGGALFAVAEAQARSESGVLQCNCHASWTAGVAFLGALGFSVHARIDVMRCDALESRETGPPPLAQFRSSQPGEEDDAAWLAISNAAYAQDETASVLCAADTRLLREAEGFDLVLAEVDGKLVALCHTRSGPDTDVAVIESLAVHPAARGRGLGGAILGEAMRRLRERGVRGVELTVNADNVAARKVYDRFGFHPVDEIRTYRRAATDRPQ